MQGILRAQKFQVLLDVLSQEHTIIGPTVRDQAIVYEPVQRVLDLPIGWRDEQSPGVYKLHKRQDEAFFGFVVGPHSWKKVVFPAQEKIWSVEKSKSGELAFKPGEQDEKKYALLGVRGCELAGLKIMDKVFIGSTYQDPRYQNRRERVFIVSVQCTTSASTCFCTSMKTGPEVKGDFDLLLTEVVLPSDHYFVVEAGSKKGEQVFKHLPLEKIKKSQIATARAEVKKARDQVEKNKQIPLMQVKKLLYDNPNHERWDEVAKKCLSCANCTMVCPTCFCSSVEDVTDLTGDHSERWRQWDSCFTLEHSYIHGGAVHASTKSRYRQWMTHKLASWWDQFDTSGCVGCGRCVTWCPVGIDIRDEVAAIAAGPREK